MGYFYEPGMGSVLSDFHALLVVFCVLGVVVWANQLIPCK